MVDDGDRLTPSLTRGQQYELKQLIDSTPMLNYLCLVPEVEAEKAMGTMTQVEWKCDMIVHYARRTRCTKSRVFTPDDPQSLVVAQEVLDLDWLRAYLLAQEIAAYNDGHTEHLHRRVATLPGHHTDHGH